MKFLRDESGGTAMEYGLLVALASLAILASVYSLGSSLRTAYGSLADDVQWAAQTLG